MGALDDLVEDLAAVMGGPCILEDPGFRLLGFSDQRDVDVVRQRSILERGSTQDVRDWFYSHGIGDAESPLRTPADDPRGIVSRVCIPVRHLGRLLGFFWLLDADGTIHESKWPEAAPFAEAAGALLSLAERRQAHRDALYRDVVEGGPRSARPAADELAGASGLRLDEPVVVALIDRPDLVTQLSSRPSRSGMLWARESGGLCAAIVRYGGQPLRSMPLPEVLSALGLSRRMPELDQATFVGIGPVVPSLDDLDKARSGALVALRVARHSGSHVTVWDELGPLALLGIARDTDLARTLIPPAVAGFLSTGPEPLVETARIYLEEAASVARTATRLHLHRHTVYHRLKAIEHATSVDLDAGAGRLTLHLALELAPYVLPAADRTS
ncbi:CdaR family transcriptional regulator [Amycolatopsis sp. GM8]|uniref:PucR family transcriptional regulator n=1 Tax=Amycolatopsis sp. GM8 TaxID=2896530 RepID=UPI001F1F8E03|nr:helix-turn-helix domain-containing protein [Amycolatopsis sp. GM8]